MKYYPNIRIPINHYITKSNHLCTKLLFRVSPSVHFPTGLGKIVNIIFTTLTRPLALGNLTFCSRIMLAIHPHMHRYPGYPCLHHCNLQHELIWIEQSWMLMVWYRCYFPETTWIISHGACLIRSRIPPQMQTYKMQPKEYEGKLEGDWS